MRILQLFLVLPMLAAAASPPVPSPVHDIAAANRHYITVLHTGHPAEIALDYESGGRFLSPRADVRGRAHLAQYFANRMRGIVLDSGTCTTRHLEVYGSTATETGTCHLLLRRAGRPSVVNGPYVTVWAYNPAEQRWLIRFDVVPE